MLGETASVECLDLAQTIERRILQRTWRRIRQLRVQAIDGRIIIQGCAPSYYVKQLVVQAVLEAVGPDKPGEVVLEIDVGAGPYRPVAEYSDARHRP